LYFLKESKNDTQNYVKQRNSFVYTMDIRSEILHL